MKPTGRIKSVPSSKPPFLTATLAAWKQQLVKKERGLQSPNPTPQNSILKSEFENKTVVVSEIFSSRGWFYFF